MQQLTMKSHFNHLVGVTSIFTSVILPLAAEPEASVGSVPDELAEVHQLDTGFYRKHVDAGGIPVFSSENAQDAALLEVRHLILKLLANREDIRKAMSGKNVRVGVMAYNEFTTDMPETRTMESWWDKRARGLGGNPVTCGEENVLNFNGDPYHGENIFIHEFAHSIHLVGLRAVDQGFQERLDQVFEQAKKSARFSGYCMENAAEFWAEGVQSWFDCNNPQIMFMRDDGSLMPILNREDLKSHMPELAKLLQSIFGGNDWQYTTSGQRCAQPHLAAFDRGTAPVFVWPAKVLAAAEEKTKRDAESGMQ
jgi:hypothetical protein